MAENAADESLLNPVSQVYFRAGLIACREYMARFVEAESPSIANSIRANWWPSLGVDYGPPRKLAFNELTEGEYGTPAFRCKTQGEVSPTLEALPVALGFLLNAEAGAVDAASSVGAQDSSSLMRSSSSLRTLVEQLLTALKAASQFLDPEVSRGPAIYGWQNSVDLVEAAIAKADELAALLSPVEGRTKDDALSRSPTDGSASTTGSPRTPLPESSQR